MTDRRRWPMIPRVLAVLMTCVLTVQFANFGLLQLIPLPQPPVFTAREVATALNGHAGDRFRTSRVTQPAVTRPGREARIRDALARELSLPPSEVAVSFRVPLGAGIAPGPMYMGPPPKEPAPLLVGDFTASRRVPNGQWFAVRPSSTGMAAWRIRLTFWLVIALFTITPFAWLLARWVSRPIAMFAGAAERIGRDLRTEPLQIEGPAELAHAAAAFNEMQRRLLRYIDDRTLMIGAIAHDLRTPLMRMSLRLDRLTPDAKEALRGDIVEMETMIAAGMAYVRDATELRPRRRLDLRSLAESIADDRSDCGEAVSVLPGSKVVLDADASALKALVNNLVGNAIRYAGAATIDVREENGGAVIEVLDRGPGASPDDLDRLFEPFFRGEASRNRHTGGLGLGLASVRGVARMHGGDAIAFNRNGGGLGVKVTLPI